jgi:hypothetical protein
MSIYSLYFNDLIVLVFSILILIFNDIKIKIERLNEFLRC